MKTVSNGRRGKEGAASGDWIQNGEGGRTLKSGTPQRERETRVRIAG